MTSEQVTILAQAPTTTAKKHKARQGEIVITEATLFQVKWSWEACLRRCCLGRELNEEAQGRAFQK